MAPPLINDVFPSLFTSSLRTPETTLYLEALVASFGCVKRSSLDDYITLATHNTTVAQLYKEIAITKASINTRIAALQEKIDTKITAAWKDRLETDPNLLRIIQEYNVSLEGYFTRSKAALYDMHENTIQSARDRLQEEKTSILKEVSRSGEGSDLARAVANEVTSPAFYSKIIVLSFAAGAAGAYAMTHM